MATMSVEPAPRFKVAGWYVCDWIAGYEAWVFDTKAEATAFSDCKKDTLPAHHHLNVSWLSPPVSGRLGIIDILKQISSRMDSTKIHDCRTR